MRRITINGLVFGLPFETLLRGLTAEEFGRLDADIAVNGVQQAVVTATTPTWGRIVVDGMHRATVCERRSLDIPTNLVISLGRITEAQARERALALNLNRRHLTLEEQQAARGERIPRVTARRANGDSYGVIAEAEGVSIAQVRRDLQDAETIVPGGTMPETPVQVVTTAGHTYRPPPKPKRERTCAKARSTADALVGAVRVLMKSQHRGRFAAIAEAAGVPIGEREWPALEVLRAVLRDLASGSVSA